MSLKMLMFYDLYKMMQQDLSYSIRKACLEDARAIHEVHMYSILHVCVLDHGQEEVAGWGNRPYDQTKWHKAIATEKVWVLEEQTTLKIKGYACYLLKDDAQKKIAYLAGLYFHPDCIGLGYGKRMMHELMLDAKLAGATVMQLESTITAFEFYKKLNFVVVGPMFKEDVGGSMVSATPMQRTI